MFTCGLYFNQEETIWINDITDLGSYPKEDIGINT